MSVDTKIGPDEALLKDAAAFQEKYPDSLILGSVARAAIMGTYLENSRPSGVERDIDVMRLGDRHDDVQSLFKRDFDTIFEDWITPDGSYLVFPHDTRLQVPIKHPEVLQPRDVRIGEYTLSLPHPDVLGKISTMQFIQRPKDKRAAKEYGQFLQSSEDRLPDELLEPFDTMRTALSHRNGYRARGYLRDLYHLSLPERYRKKVQLGERLHWLRRH